MRTKTQKTKQKDKTETKMKIIAYFRKNENCAGVGVGGRMHRLSGTYRLCCIYSIWLLYRCSRKADIDCM